MFPEAIPFDPAALFTKTDDSKTRLIAVKFCRPFWGNSKQRHNQSQFFFFYYIYLSLCQGNKKEPKIAIVVRHGFSLS